MLSIITSTILFPELIDHFRELIPKYKSFLNPWHVSSFKGITYEEFISVLRELTVDVGFLRRLHSNLRIVKYYNPY